MLCGYNGKILHVDLTNGKFRVEEPGVAFYRKYMGGSALAMYYLLKEVPANVNPLGPKNVLVLALSVLTGTAISGQSRMTAAAKSPLTGAIGDSQGGGFFPAELKFAGFDAIEVQGTAEGHAFRREELDAMLALAQSGIEQLIEHQRDALAQ